MKTGLLLVIACVVSASSGCGGQHLILGEGPDDVEGGGAGGAIPDDHLDLIDDMEDGDERLLFPPHDGRTGRWTTYNDGTPGATQWPLAQGLFTMSLIDDAAKSPTGDAPRGSSARAARTKGQGFQAMPTGGWATMELSFIGGAPPPAGSDAGLFAGSYDAHRYEGITFFARVGSNTQTEVRVNLTTPQTLPQGGTCTACYDSFGETISFTTEWKQYVMAFGELQQRGFGDVVPVFDAYHVYTVSFGFVGPTPFDLWIDDIAFYKQ